MVSAGQPRPTIDLGGLKVASLKDNDGRNWFEQEKPLDPEHEQRSSRFSSWALSTTASNSATKAWAEARSAPSASSAEQGFESATQEGTAQKPPRMRKSPRRAHRPKQLGRQPFGTPAARPARCSGRTPGRQLSAGGSQASVNGSSARTPQKARTAPRTGPTWCVPEGHGSNPNTRHGRPPATATSLSRMRSWLEFFACPASSNRQRHYIREEQFLATLRPESQCPGWRRFWHWLKKPLKLLAARRSGVRS